MEDSWLVAGAWMGQRALHECYTGSLCNWFVSITAGQSARIANANLSFSDFLFLQVSISSYQTPLARIWASSKFPLKGIVLQFGDEHALLWLHETVSPPRSYLGMQVSGQRAFELHVG